MCGKYDLNGNIILERECGEVLKLSYEEALEIFATLADVKIFSFNRDGIIEEIVKKLHLY